jgi:hypothetical protein
VADSLNAQTSENGFVKHVSLEENLSSITTHKLTHFCRSAVHFAIYFLQPRRRHLTSEMAYRLRTLLDRRYRAFDIQYESLGEPIPGGPQLHCRFVVQSSHPALSGVVCKYWAPKISGSFRFRLLTAEARCEKMRAGKADRFLVRAVTQNCECEAVGHQTISANPSSWHLGGEIPLIWIGRRTALCLWLCYRAAAGTVGDWFSGARCIRESGRTSLSRASNFVELCSGRILSFDVSWAQRSRSREAWISRVARRRIAGAVF